MSPEGRAKLDRELEQLARGGQRAELLAGTEEVVLYNDLPTSGAKLGLPALIDVIAPVPAGYPAMIDLAGLPSGSPLLAHLKGGSNCQRTIVAGGRDWTIVSYHPHGNGGGPSWDPTRHGFHTYLGELLAWLVNVT